MKDLLRTLLGQPLSDVVLCGIVDLGEDPADFVPLLERVYLEVGGQLVELSREKYSVHLNVAIVSAIYVDCELEETYRVCRSSVGAYVLTNRFADNRITSIDLYVDRDDRLLTMELRLICGQTLFFDPSFIDGINFGEADQRHCWLENAVAYELITLDGFGP